MRFIFVRPLADYLRVAAPRDVIERPIEAELDLGGWDLRKALGLIVQSNAVVLEWLASPIVYRSHPALVAAMNDLARQSAHLSALAYHYDRIARKAWTAGDADLRLKSYCYALRPALALLWLRGQGTPPPMDLTALRAGVAVPQMVDAAIETLLAQKAAAREADTVARAPALERFLSDALAERAPRPGAWDQAPARAAADELFRACALAG